MRLEGNFYTIDSITSLTEGEYTAIVTLAKEHHIYEGHFPNQPVVPGVCTLTIIRETLGEILSRPASFASIKDCKYVSALIPEEGLRIAINLSLSDTKLKATVERCDNQQIVLKLRAEIR